MPTLWILFLTGFFGNKNAKDINSILPLYGLKPSWAIVPKGGAYNILVSVVVTRKQYYRSCCSSLKKAIARKNDLLYYYATFILNIINGKKTRRKLRRVIL